jgi:CHAD domain-containing protein
VSFRVDFHESAGDSLRRVAGERLDDAIEQLDTEFARGPESAVHEARKDAKKARALLRLYRGDLDRAKAAKALAELLGDDHDLAVLDARLGEYPPAEVADARELVAHRREELQDEALRLGRRVYAESPKRFRQRIGRYLQAGRRDSRAAAAT